MKNRILIIDGPNVALKYIALKSKINVEVSILKQIAFFYQKFKPDEVYICWEGENSRKPRQNILKEYKANRHKISNQRNAMKKANNMDMGDIEQQITLFKTKLFKNLPIHQLFINNLEADDVIANLTRIHNEDNIIIISADADFYQLLSDNVIIYNHLKKNYVTLKDISKEIANPFNFIWQKAIVGDKSDNIDGIKGLGIKTFQKIFVDHLHKEEKWKPNLIKEILIKNGKEEFINDILKNFRVIQLFIPLHALASLEVKAFCEANGKYKFDNEEIIKYFKTFNNFDFTKNNLKLILIPFAEFMVRKTFGRK